MVNNPFLSFVPSVIFIIIVTMVLLLAVRLLYSWQIQKYLKVDKIIDGQKFYNQEQASIIITNGSHDLDNFLVELKSLYRVGLPSRLLITNREPVFIRKDKIPANESVFVNIGEVFTTDKGKCFINFLVNGGLLCDFAIYDTDVFLKEKPDPRGGKWYGTIYELVIRVSGSIEKDRINQFYLMKIKTIQAVYDNGDVVNGVHVIGVRKYNNRKDGKRYKLMSEGRLSPNGLTSDDFWQAHNI